MASQPPSPNSLTSQGSTVSNSKKKSPSKSPSQTTSLATFGIVKDQKDAEYYVTPEFIYGGPFIVVKVPSPFIDSATPMNLQCEGTFTRSFAYYSLKERMPVILTKIIDGLSKKNSADSKAFIEVIAKMKNELVTNKEYEKFKLDTPELKLWNKWIGSLQNKKYFNNAWLFTECYVYRRLYEFCEMTPSLKNYDYFEDQKRDSFQNNLKPMCIVADKAVTMFTNSDQAQRKADFQTLLKLSLWSNKCDLSLSLGEKVTFGEFPEAEAALAAFIANPPPPPATGKAKGKGKQKGPVKPVVPSSNPLQMIVDLKDKLLVDDSGKVADQMFAKSESMEKAIAGNTVFKQKCSCERLAKLAKVAICKKDEPPPAPPAEGAEPPEKPKIPCPAKMTIPNHIMVDIVCDNAGYELFTDLCVATFILEQNIAQIVRFHLKKMPWFISDATIEDFKYVVKAASSASFSAENPLPPNPAGEVVVETINSQNLNQLGQKWQSLLDEGKFLLLCEDYWTYPHSYFEMKMYDYDMYRKLQYSIAVLFKGDLNYRKLLGDRFVNPYAKLEPTLQGFIPAPIVAIRTIKSEPVCGLPKGRFDVLNKLDAHWNRKGDYGTIQYCGRTEKLKVSDRPCVDYCDTCFGLICPEHDRDM